MFVWGKLGVVLVVDLLGPPSRGLAFSSLAVLNGEPNYIYLDI